jgi:hypothetical protein
MVRIHLGLPTQGEVMSEIGLPEIIKTVDDAYVQGFADGEEIAHKEFHEALTKAVLEMGERTVALCRRALAERAELVLSPEWNHITRIPRDFTGALSDDNLMAVFIKMQEEEK